MPTADELKDLQRRGIGRAVQPIPPPPEFPKEIWRLSAEQRQAATERYNQKMADWSKNLAKEKQSEPTLTEEQVQQLRGPRGRPGKDGVTRVIQETVTRIETVPPVELTVIELGLQKQVFLAMRTDNRPGTGKLSDPFDVSTPEKWIAVMRNNIGEYYDIVLLPGVYLTYGLCHEKAVTTHWRLREGCRLRGCGMERTTLKLVGGDVPGRYAVVYSGIAFNADDAFWQTDSGGSAAYPWTEVSDLTVDCNFQNQGTTNLVNLHAVMLQGNYTRIARVRVINAGSNYAGQEAFLLLVQPQPWSVSTSPVTWGVIEDCIVENVQHVNVAGAGLTAIAAFSGNEAADNGARAHNAVVRGNMVDGQFADGTIPYPGMPSATTKQTFNAIGMTAGYSAVMERNHLRNVGAGIYTDTGWGHESILRGNTFYNVVSGIYTNFNGQQYSGPPVVRWGIGRIIVENNDLVLMTTVGKTGHTGCNGITLWDGSNSAAGLYQFKELVVRENFVSLLENSSDAANVVGAGIWSSHAENAVVENNFLRIPNSVFHASFPRDSIIVNKNARLQCRNNRRPEDNTLILPWSFDLSRYLHDQEYEQKKAAVMMLSRF